MTSIEQRAGLRGKQAIVIGGGYGIGAAVTLALAGSGVHVAICDNDAENLPKTASAAEALGVNVFSEMVDALDVKALADFYANAGKRLGHADIVVNVVGGTKMRLFDETGPEDWADDIHRNYAYVIHSTRAGLPLIRKSGKGGSIISFTTIEAHRGAASIAVYSGAKAGLTAYSRAMAVELARERIRFNTIASDGTPSRGNMRAMPQDRLDRLLSLPEDDRAQGRAIITPMGDVAPPDALGDAVLFLASDLSAWVTGTVLHVDAGTWASSGFNQWPHGDGFSPSPGPESNRRLFADGSQA